MSYINIHFFKLVEVVYVRKGRQPAFDGAWMRHRWPLGIIWQAGHIFDRPQLEGHAPIYYLTEKSTPSL